MSSSRSASSDNGGGSYWGVGKLSLGGIGKVLATAVENQIAATVSPTAVSLPHNGNGSTGNIDQRPPPAKRSPHAQSKLSTFADTVYDHSMISFTHTSNIISQTLWHLLQAEAKLIIIMLLETPLELRAI